MNHSPLVSIIVPVYNVEKICVNDGSIDHCIDILNAYKNKDNRIVIIDKNNEGVSTSRNKALSLATGEYISFVDADDWIELETIERSVEISIRYNSDVVMWGYTSEHGNRSDVRHLFQGDVDFVGLEVKKRLHRRLVGIIKEELSSPERADCLCTVWGKLYKRESVIGVAFVPLEFIGSYEDGLFNLEVFGKISHAYYIDKSMYHYRRGNINAQTSRYRPLLQRQWHNLFMCLMTYIEKNSLDEDYYEALNNRIALSSLGLGLNVLASSETQISKVHSISDIIQDDYYKQASSHLDLSFFPLKWKLFYYFSKHGYSFLLYIMLIVIRMVITS